MKCWSCGGENALHQCKNCGRVYCMSGASTCYADHEEECDGSNNITRPEWVRDTIELCYDLEWLVNDFYTGRTDENPLLEYAKTMRFQLKEERIPPTKKTLGVLDAAREDKAMKLLVENGLLDEAKSRASEIVWSKFGYPKWYRGLYTDMVNVTMLDVYGRLNVFGGNNK